MPQKIVGGVYNDLLRSQEPEVHGLVTRSLGVLVPTLPYRFRKHKNQHSPPWIDATKATITDSKGKVPARARPVRRRTAAAQRRRGVGVRDCRAVRRPTSCLATPTTPTGATTEAAEK